MKKRLRKKRRLGEFQELGFPVSFTAAESAFDEFIEMIEQHNLQYGGSGCEDTWEGFVEGEWRRSVTGEQRETVGRWLSNHPRIESVAVGEFVDMWA